MARCKSRLRTSRIFLSETVAEVRTEVLRCGILKAAPMFRSDISSSRERTHPGFTVPYCAYPAAPDAELSTDFRRASWVKKCANCLSQCNFSIGHCVAQCARLHVRPSLGVHVAHVFLYRSLEE